MIGVLGDAFKFFCWRLLADVLLALSLMARDVSVRLVGF